MYLLKEKHTQTLNCQPKQSANNGTLRAFFQVTFSNLAATLPPEKKMTSDIDL